jgi:ubiquitin carboxyl-terminal hydrolase 4/11/15
LNIALQAVSEAANIAWQNHRARNLSIIVELLQGQLQSTLRCPTCQRVSVTFDPFMYLSLPISAPVARDRRVSLTYLAAEGQTPIQLVVAVPHTGSIVQLQQAVATLMGTPSCIIAEAYKHRIYKVLNSRDSLSDIQPGDDLLAFGQEKPTEGSICVQVLHEVRPSEMSAPQLFGTPLVIELPPACPGHVLWALVATRVKMWLPSSLSKMPTQKMLDSIFAGKALPFRIRIREALRCGLCTRAQCTGCEVSRSLDDDRSCGVKSSHSIVLEWNTDMVREHADRFDQVAVHSSAQHSAPVKAHSESVTTLNDCVDAFISEERLGKNDTWYCSACKQHVMATKKLDLWRCPEVLIVHLKRFSAHREKIGRLVDFPLHGLDLSRFVRGAQEETAPVYDLFAVSNHMGGLHGGHYNAFSRNLENDRWYLCDDSHTEPVAEHAVKTEKAYVLFYRRRH